jgi:hypothetical protein
MTAPIDRASFDALAAHLRLPLTEAQADELHEMYRHLEPKIARVCGARPRDAEPALIFRPELPA